MNDQHNRQVLGTTGDFVRHIYSTGILLILTGKARVGSIE